MALFYSQTRRHMLMIEYASKQTNFVVAIRLRTSYIFARSPAALHFDKYNITKFYHKS